MMNTFKQRLRSKYKKLAQCLKDQKYIEIHGPKKMTFNVKLLITAHMHQLFHFLSKRNAHFQL